MKLIDLLKLLVGLGEEIIPIFIHNPQSKKVEAIIVTGVDHALDTLTAMQTQAPVQTTTTTTVTKGNAQ